MAKDKVTIRAKVKVSLEDYDELNGWLQENKDKLPYGTLDEWLDMVIENNFRAALQQIRKTETKVDIALPGRDF